MTPEFGFDPSIDDQASLLAKVDAAYIVSQLGQMDAVLRERFIADIADALSHIQSGYTSIDQKHRINTRYLKDGAEVTQNAAGVTVGLTGGKGQFDIVNFISPSQMYIDSATNARQIDIKVGGGGADCMFDYLVSTCFATLAGFTEGQTFTSLSGCTFRGYSTIQGALTAAGVLAASDSSTVAICSGVYAEQITRTDVNNASLTLLGTGQGNTIIKPGAGKTGNVFSIPNQLNAENAVIISGITFDTTSMTAGAIAISAGPGQRIKMNNCRVNAAGASDIGINMGTGAPAWTMSQINFGGAGTGVETSGNPTAPESIISNCAFESTLAVGVLMRAPGQVLMVNACLFASVIGITMNGVGAQNSVEITGCSFVSCVTGIQHTSGNGANTQLGISISGNGFYNCGTSCDFSALTNNLLGVSITGNNFVGLGANIGIALHATRFKSSIILGNTFNAYTAGNEVTGQTLAQAQTANVQITHNTTDSGTPILDSGLGHASGTGVPPGTGGAASAGEPFATIGNTAGLSAERAITPRYNLYAIDGGANSTYTLDSWLEGAAIASAATLTLGTDGDMFHVTGSVNITAIATPTRQTLAVLVFDGSLLLTNSANLLLQGGVDFQASANDVLIMAWEGGTVWREINRHTSFLFEHHTLMANLSNATASTTVPYAKIGPLAADATITGVEASTGSNIACGATSAIIDIHRVLTANKNTDGVGTTIYATQANRPTISNGNMLSTTTLPALGQRSLSAGDLLLVYLDQSGTGLDDIWVGVRVTMTVATT